ncbi:MAG TPA: hypothetical protein VEC93_22910 [Anaerolineae bacterium]|nr:hypothetical protein [Anaerolineae bacterium]
MKTSVTADEALQHLLEGNRRYSTNRVTDLNQTPVRRIEVAQAQYPFATIFGCVDSRVPPEITFLKTSTMLAEAIAKNQLKIVGARYDLVTGAIALTVS